MKEVKLWSVKVTDQYLEVGQKYDGSSASILNSEIRNSTLVLSGKSGYLTLEDSKFENCIINGQNAYQHFLTSASWLNCKFKGRFSDCAFGAGFDSTNLKEIPIKIENSDFSNANLDVVVFGDGLHYSTCRWPSFPHALVIPDELPDNIDELPLPPELIGLLQVCDSKHSRHTAVVYDLTRFDKDLERIFSVTFNVPGFHFFGDSNPPRPTINYIESSQNYYSNHKVLFKRYTLWYFISQSVSITSINIGNGIVTVNLKSSSKPHIPLPERFSIRLKGVSNFDLAECNFLTEIRNKNSYRIMGAKMSDNYETVKLKGHRKELGQIEMAYEKAEFIDQDGNVINIDSLNKWCST